MRLLKAYVCRTLPALLMAVAVFLLFARSVSFSYIGIDDAAYTFRNPFVASGLTLDGIVEAFSNFRHGGIWMPVTYIMYMIDFSVCKLFGFPLMATMHVVNALLHAVNFLLLLRLMRRLVLGCGNGEDGICDLQWGRHDSATTEHTEGFICDLRLKCGARSRSGDAASASHTERNCAPQFSRDGEGAVATTASHAIGNRKSEILPITNCQLPTTHYQSGKDSASPFPILSCFSCIPWFSSNRKSEILPTTHYPLPTINRKPNLWWLFTMLFCVLACLSKPTAMCFPFLAMLVEWLVSRSRNGNAALLDGAALPYRDSSAAHHCSGDVSPLPTTHYPLPTTNYQLPTIHYQLLLLLPALIWALHPLRVEPVAWIAARKELLWTSFTLLGLLCWTNMLYRRPQITNSESGVAEPVSRWPIVSRLLPYLPMLVVAGATAAIAAYSQTHVAGQGDTSLYAASFGHRLVNALSAIGFYLRTTFWPVGLHIDCRAVNSLMPLDGVANLAVLAGVCLGFVIYGLLRLRSRIVVARTLGKEAESFPLQDGEGCCPQWKRLGNRFSLGSGDAAPASHAERNCAPQFSRDGEGAVATPRFADGFLPHRIRAQSEIENTTNYQLPTTNYQSGKDSASPFSRLPCFSCIPWFSFNRKSQIDQSKILPTTNYQLPTINHQSEIENRKSEILPTTHYFFSFLWFMIGLLPTLGIFGGFGIESHADRFTYLPMMGFSFLLAAWLVDLSRRDADARWLRVVNWILAIAVALLAATSFRQLGFWKDNAEAYGRALVCDSGHPRAMVHVADALCSRRRNFDAGIAMYRNALSLADTVPEGGFNVGDVRARLAYALASRGGYDDFDEVKRLGADVLRNLRLDRRGMMLDALGTAFMNEGDLKRAAVLFRASIDAPDRFWPKASTKRKLEMCR